MLAVLGGVFFAVSTFVEDLDSQKRKLQAENASLIAEKTSLMDKKNKATSSLELYQKIRKKNQSEDFSVDREVGANIFKELRERYRLKLAGENSFSQIMEITEPGFKRDSGIVVKSDARLGFEAVTDEIVFQFIHGLYSSMPGFVFIESFAITRRGKIDGAALSELGRGSFPPLVSATMGFMWVGIKSKPEDTETSPRPDGAADE